VLEKKKRAAKGEARKNNKTGADQVNQKQLPAHGTPKSPTGKKINDEVIGNWFKN